MQHEPAHADGLHPGTDLERHGAAEEHAEIAMGEGRERAAGRDEAAAPRGGLFAGEGACRQKGLPESVDLSNLQEDARTGNRVMPEMARRAEPHGRAWQRPEPASVKVPLPTGAKLQE